MAVERPDRSALRTATLAASMLLAGGTAAPAAEPPLPRLVQKDGRHALLVDGAPFLILGAQVNNSSAWPADAAAGLAGHQGDPRQHRRDAGLLGAARAEAGRVRLLGRRHAGRPAPASTTFASCCSGSAPGRTAARTTCRSWMKQAARAVPADARRRTAARRLAVRRTRRRCSRPTSAPSPRSCATSRRPTRSTR